MASDEDIQQLVTAITTAGNLVDESRDVYTKLTSSLRRMRITLWVAGIGLIADLLLSGGYALIFTHQSHLNNQVQTNQAAIQKMNCDLNRVFIQADTPANRAAAADKANYDTAFHIIYSGYAQLGCQPPMPEPVRPAP